MAGVCPSADSGPIRSRLSAAWPPFVMLLGGGWPDEAQRDIAPSPSGYCKISNKNGKERQALFPHSMHMTDSALKLCFDTSLLHLG
eukprot:scaffold212712_cov17-Prasinocladus_malaysianus.AAC.1